MNQISPFANEPRSSNQTLTRVDDNLDGDYFPYSTFGRTSVTEESTSVTNGTATRKRKHPNDNSTTNVLERSKRHEIPFTSDFFRQLFIRCVFDLRIAKTQHRVPAQRVIMDQDLHAKLKHIAKKSTKIDDNIRVCFENLNDFPTKTGCHYDKVSILR